MPVTRDTVVNTPATLVRPTEHADGFGNITSHGPDAVLHTCTVGVIPKSARSLSYQRLVDGVIDTRKWTIAAIGALDARKDDAFVVTTGINPGTYRIETITRIPGEQITAFITLKED